MNLSDIWEKLKDAWDNLRTKVSDTWDDLKGNRKRLYIIIGVILFLIILLIILLLLLCRPEEEPPPPPPTPTPTPTATATVPPVEVWIEAPADVKRDELFTATVYISEVRNFDVAQYDIAYDPEVVRVIGVGDGTINETNVPVDMWGFMPPREQGVVRILNNMPGISGINGSGILATVECRAIGNHDATSSLRFIKGHGDPKGELLLGDRWGMEIHATWMDDSIHILFVPPDGGYGGSQRLVMLPPGIRIGSPMRVLRPDDSNEEAPNVLQPPSDPQADAGNKADATPSATVNTTPTPTPTSIIRGDANADYKVTRSEVAHLRCGCQRRWQGQYAGRDLHRVHNSWPGPLLRVWRRRRRWWWWWWTYSTSSYAHAHRHA